MGSLGIRAALAATLLVAAGMGEAAGMLVVGLDERGAWQLFTRDGDAPWRVVPTEEEPRTPVHDPASDMYAYVDSGGSVKTIVDGTETLLLEASERVRFTQPEFSDDGARLYVVALADGTSVDTDILAVDIASGERSAVVGQRSAQFEPAAYGDELLYSSVACIPPACDRIIEEIWSIDPLTRRARQLTLANAISREPVRDVASGALYFVSDRGGDFRVWAAGEAGDDVARPLERDAAILAETLAESSPAIGKRGGALAFIRKRDDGRDQIVLHGQGEDGTRLAEPPPGVTLMRDLYRW